jgi:hypothetical protein
MPEDEKFDETLISDFVKEVSSGLKDGEFTPSEIEFSKGVTHYSMQIHARDHEGKFVGSAWLHCSVGWKILPIGYVSAIQATVTTQKDPNSAAVFVDNLTIHLSHQAGCGYNSIDRTDKNTPFARAEKRMVGSYCRTGCCGYAEVSDARFGNWASKRVCANA